MSYKKNKKSIFEYFDQAILKWSISRTKKFFTKNRYVYEFKICLFFDDINNHSLYIIDYKTLLL